MASVLCDIARLTSISVTASKGGDTQLQLTGAHKYQLGSDVGSSRVDKTSHSTLASTLYTSTSTSSGRSLPARFQTRLGTVAMETSLASFSGEQDSHASLQRDVRKRPGSHGTPSEADWELHKATIIDIYKRTNMGHLQKEMETLHNFRAT